MCACMLLVVTFFAVAFGLLASGAQDLLQDRRGQRLAEVRCWPFLGAIEVNWGGFFLTYHGGRFEKYHCFAVHVQNCWTRGGP